MGTLVFVCPTTGQEVSTGVEVDRSSFKSLPRTKTVIFCVIDLGLVGQRDSRSSGRKSVYEACCVDGLSLSDPAQFSSLVVREAPCSGEELRLRELSPRVILDK